MVIRLEGPEGRCAVVVEVQLGDDEVKGWTWPAYLANLRARERSDVFLLVLTLDRPMARRLTRAIALGHPGFTLRPLVLGPDELPVVTDPELARRTPALAVFSALAHGRGPLGEAIGRAALAAVPSLDETRARMYVDLVLASLNDLARGALEAMMQEEYQLQSEFLRKVEARGVEKGTLLGLDDGERTILLRLIRARFGEPSPAALARLEAAGRAELERWADRVLTASSVEDLLSST